MAEANQIVRELMALRNWTQLKLAQEVGVTRVTICRWLSQESQPWGRHRDRLERLYKDAVRELEVQKHEAP